MKIEDLISKGKIPFPIWLKHTGFLNYSYDENGDIIDICFDHLPYLGKKAKFWSSIYLYNDYWIIDTRDGSARLIDFDKWFEDRYGR